MVSDFQWIRLAYFGNGIIVILSNTGSACLKNAMGSQSKRLLLAVALAYLLVAEVLPAFHSLGILFPCSRSHCPYALPCDAHSSGGKISIHPMAGDTHGGTSSDCPICSTLASLHIPIAISPYRLNLDFFLEDYLLPEKLLRYDCIGMMGSHLPRGPPAID